MVQDFIFAIGAIIFAIALVPSLRSKNKPAFSTSFTTAAVLYVFAATYASLSLWLAASTQTISAAMWTLLAYQGRTKRK